MVLGIISAVISFIPILNQGSFILGAVAVILGIVGLVLKGRKRGGAIAGLILGIVSIIIASIVIWVTLAALNAAGDALDHLSNKPKALTLNEDWTLDNSGLLTKVTGSVSNASSESFSLATITFDVRDASGANVGNCSDSVSTVDANGKWKFAAWCDTKVTDKSLVKLKDINGI